MNISSDMKMTPAAALWKNAEEPLCYRTPETVSEKEDEMQTLLFEGLNSRLELCPGQSVDDLRLVDKYLILQDRRAVMGEMISNIAHQWRQPLHVLGLQLQELPIVYSSDNFNREYLENSVAKSMQLIMHMSRTIDDFRNFFQYDKEKVPFNVNQVIEKTLALIGETFKNQHISIVIHPEGDPIVSGYPNEYSQALMNILMNSRDALVALDVVDARISIRTIKMGDTSVVTITDNAGGVADEIVDKIFDPYFTTKEPDKGTGIGLFMSKAIIEKNMAGKLTFQNIEGGAEFRIEV